MGFNKKNEKSGKRSVRGTKDIQEYRKEYFKNREEFTANDFIKLRSENNDEYKKFNALKAAEDKQPKRCA
ncbi:hypothetical protein [Campylobacter concisus]|uniref:hypothetical protein n=1 Tax=Campylobacter concisus TaxID=199 RepID=UPI000CD849A0|nr:hypothetical protein [Campylobacter concisus]